MAELEVTKEAYDQLLEKLKFWKEEQRRLLKQLAQEARHASDSPSHEALRLAKGVTGHRVRGRGAAGAD